MSRKKIGLILICCAIAGVMYWNASRMPKMQTVIDLEAVAETPEDLFLQAFGGEVREVLNEDGLRYVCGIGTDKFFRILVASEAADGWHIDEVISGASFGILGWFTGGTTMSRYDIYKSEKHRKDIVIVNRVGNEKDQALLEIPPRDSLNSSFVSSCINMQGSLYYDYFTIHDSVNSGYEVYLK